jgi:hypothetical protein
MCAMRYLVCVLHQMVAHTHVYMFVSASHSGQRQPGATCGPLACSLLTRSSTTLQRSRPRHSTRSECSLRGGSSSQRRACECVGAVCVCMCERCLRQHTTKYASILAHANTCHAGLHMSQSLPPYCQQQLSSLFATPPMPPVSPTPPRCLNGHPHCLPASSLSPPTAPCAPRSQKHDRDYRIQPS